MRSGRGEEILAADGLVSAGADGDHLDRDIHIIDDTYNSNPAALEAALQGMAELPGRRKLAALGDMLEL
ncbi:MAG: hypothetical protein GY778_01595, partial [bacterium]|nr:hypothetical protein [bacterium]